MKKIILLFTLVITLFTINIKNALAIEGIDVSLWQGEIDFKKVKDDGIKIVYIRSSAGNAYKDRDFEKNYKNAKEACLDIGVYHFVTARTVEEGKEQARFFASVISEKEIDCRLAMDFEVFKGLSKEEINDISRAFLETLKSLTNKELVIYSDAYNARFVFDKSLFDDYPLWVAEYDAKKPSVDDYIGWQYTDKGRINGIKGNVDRDIFTDEIYLSDKSSIKKLDIKEKKKVYYRVHKNDTLSHIAKKYKTPLKKVIRDNNIKNPDLIFPNQVIIIETEYEYFVSSEGDTNSYIVKKGDNLTKISKIYHTLVSNLFTWNHIKNPNLIFPNQNLTIKPSNEDHLIRYVVKKGDSLKSIADYFETSVIELALINNIHNTDILLEEQIIYVPEHYILEK